MAGTAGAGADLEVAGAVVVVVSVAALLAFRASLLFHLALAGLTVGTLAADKVFAHLSVSVGGLPVYVTDAALGLVLVGIFLSPALRASAASGMRSFAPLVPFLAWGGILLVLALPLHGLDAVRDFAIFYYLLFVPVGYVALSCAGRDGFLLLWAAGGAVIVARALVVAATGSGESLSFGVGYAATRAIAGQSSVYLIVTFLAAMSVVTARSRWRPAIAALAVACLAGIYLGQQRSAWIALVAGVLVVLVLHPAWQRRLPRLSLLVLPALVLLGIVLLELSQLPGQRLPGGLDRLAAGVLSPRSDPTAAWRLAAWSQALTVVQGSPITGAGLGTVFMWNFGLELVQNHPHNTFLTVMVKSGFVGVCLLAPALLWMYVTALRRSLQADFPADDRRLLVALLAGHVAMTAWGAFNLMLESPYLAWPYWALAGGILALSSRRPA